MFTMLKVAFIVLNTMILMDFAKGITLRNECPDGEVYRSCAFYNENTCWVRADHMDRVMSPRTRLPHCKAGCFCRKGLVREFPNGPCIIAAGCRNRELQAVLKNLPTGRPFKIDLSFIDDTRRRS